MTRLLIAQPYVPEYRVPFFEGLRDRLASQGTELVLAAPRLFGAADLRGDDRSLDAADVLLEETVLQVGGRRLHARNLGSAIRRWSPDLVIVEQAIKNLEAYPLLLRRLLRSGPRVAMWGQGRTFSTPQPNTEAAFKQWLTQRCDWFFAYTDEGAKFVSTNGFAPSRITVVRNTIDTSSLSEALEAPRDADVAMYREQFGLSEGRIALFIGGVDDRKGIPFLIDAARRVESRLPGFRLLLAGSGEAVDEVRAAEASGAPIRYLGRVEGEGKAMALRACDLLMIPRWVGLVAVDSLVAGRPIVTTKHSSHSPEFGYLRDGANAVVTEDDVDQYAAAVVALLGDRPRLMAVQESARADSADYSLDQMIDNFASGVAQWLRTA